MDILQTLVAEFKLKQQHVENVIALLDDGNTIPFIARYRKEQTGALDDPVLRELAERLTYLRNLNETREKYRATIEEQGALTEELAAALDTAVTMTELDDLYRPYRPKRRTRATVAKEKGLEPLALEIFKQDGRNPEDLAKAYVASDELDVAKLKRIPLVFAGWLRYLMGVNDNGEKFELSPDPLLETVCPYVAGLELGKAADAEALKPLLEDAKIWGVNLYEVGMAEKVVGYLTEMIAGPGAVRATLQKYV